MKILNSVDNKKYELSGKTIAIYNCGPTVYNYVHIGNVRPLIIFDVLYRYLLKNNKKVAFYHNITDIDDKIINAAKQNNTTEQKISQKYTQAYLDLFSILNIKKMEMPKVSDHIQDIITYIQNLIDAGFAYVVGNDVYFDVMKIPNYGKISHQNIKNLLNGVRKDNNENKRHPLDFVLWKATNEGLSWNSPWGQKGRPGWHTECCVMINKYLGQQITIHGGGVDLKFPHHENENAQNYALFKKDIAKYWMHVGHVNINGEKMSKSLNNFILVKDIVNKDNANGLRWFFYKTKYQHPLNFTVNSLNEAISEVNRLTDALAAAKTILLANKKFKNIQVPFDPEFIKAIEDDLNLPNALAQLSSMQKQLNILIRQMNFEDSLKVYMKLVQCLDVLGISLAKYEHDKHIDLINQWHKATLAKDYNAVDKYREQLKKVNLF